MAASDSVGVISPAMAPASVGSEIVQRPQNLFCVVQFQWLETFQSFLSTSLGSENYLHLIRSAQSPSAKKSQAAHLFPAGRLLREALWQLPEPLEPNQVTG